MAAVKRIIQIGSESCVRFSKFWRVSAVSDGKKVQTGGSLGYYSQKSNGLQDRRPEKLPYDIANSRQIWEDSKKELDRQTDLKQMKRLRANYILTIIFAGSMVSASALAGFVLCSDK